MQTESSDNVITHYPIKKLADGVKFNNKLILNIELEAVIPLPFLNSTNILSLLYFHLYPALLIAPLCTNVRFSVSIVSKQSTSKYPINKHCQSYILRFYQHIYSWPLFSLHNSAHNQVEITIYLTQKFIISLSVATRWQSITLDGDMTRRPPVRQCHAQADYLGIPCHSCRKKTQILQFQ